MPILILFMLVMLSPGAFSHEACETGLTPPLQRGPIQLDVSQKQLSWKGEDGLQHVFNLPPRALEALHAMFVAAQGIHEELPIPRQAVLASHAQLYPQSTFKALNLFASIFEANHELTIEDPLMTYRMLSGRYKDELTFKWGEKEISVDEDEYTILSLILANPNKTQIYSDILEALKKAHPRWALRSEPQIKLNAIFASLRRKHPGLPVEMQYRVGLRWVQPDLTGKMEFRGFSLDTELCRLSWKDGERELEVRLNTIECAVVKERFRAGESKFSWQQVFENPIEERLKTASLGALRVHFTRVRNKVRELSPEAVERLSVK